MRESSVFKNGPALDRRSFLRAGLAFGGAVAGAGLLGACGGPGSASGGSGAKTLTIGTVVVDDTLNPMEEQFTTFQFNAFDGLVRRLRGDTEAVPRLAEEWSQKSDTVWRFKLRSGATFHNGSPVTADDVVFSFTELLGQKYANASLIDTIKDVRKVDATTVEIETTVPDPLLLSRVGQVFVVPADYWRRKGADGFAQAPIGSGPFKIESFSVDRGVEFAAFDGFWGDKPKTSEITLRYFSDPDAMAAALQAGQIDAAQNLGAQSIKTLDGRDGITVDTDFSGNQNMFQLNTSKAPFDDVRVRQAAVKAIDAKALIQAMTYGAGVLEDGQLPVKGVFGHSPGITRPAYDLAEAKSLLRSAGAEGAEIEIFGMSLYKKLYEAIGAQLQQAGFKPKINAVEVPVWVKTFRNGSDADIFYRGASYTGIFDAERPYSFVSSSKKPFVKDAEWDGLMKAQRTEMDSAEREKKLIDCSRHLLDRSYILYTYGGPTVGAHREGVTGFDNSNGLMLLLDGISKQGS
ncbi:ABC transporter substrate-binding protein [Actinomadura algeriensis]|uniref:Peptide/nickel transport system substrate-binding protein n=1 Tax=Actinomadura algeriensis TaxID=1679523 RepID=A0ABR9K1G6_9ACTN|nr:ABC transporter substrate-binding protein [Actinomadura algeriensis]MBE1536563.1 peptide/nickel transport system substrate-binding protein [Actinomadura algeriensis]